MERTRCSERHRNKCGQYWPELEGSNIPYGMYNILSENIENYKDFILTDLRMINTLGKFTTEDKIKEYQKAIQKAEDWNKRKR
jgi:hypothetical protein